MVRKIVEKVPETQLQLDLEKYQKRALELGATDAKIITTDMIVVDERVRAKCLFPKCKYYGTNAHCPPHAIDLEMARKITNRFGYAIFTRFEVKAEEFCGPEANSVPSHLKTIKIVSKIESEAFYDGYHLSLGLGCGSCKNLYCRNVECDVLAGKGCRHALKARASMEGFGIDVFTLAAKVGWAQYPIGVSATPTEVPCGATYGLVFIW